jgi:hypothetical protein
VGSQGAHVLADLTELLSLHRHRGTWGEACWKNDQGNSYGPPDSTVQVG